MASGTGSARRLKSRPEGLCSGWQVRGSGDFNSDGKSDILWQNVDGTPGIWLMNGMSVITAGAVGSASPGSDWHLIG